MMRLYVDGQPCDIGGECVVPCGFDADSLADLVAARTGRSLTLTLPRSATNDRIFCHADDIYAAERFNASHHTARIDFGPVTLMEGTAVLLSTRLNKGHGGYGVRITEGAAEWAEKASHTTLGETPIEFDMTLTPTDIAATWEGERAVRFLPVCRERSEAGVSSSLVQAQRVMLTDDYHPFISVAALVRTIFESAGYGLESRFFESDEAQSLYVSGAYHSTDAVRAKARMDFLARRKTAVSATADALGRVYASPSVALHSVGNVVDTASPVAVDDDGKVMADTFTNGDCFRTDEYGYACFVPATAATVGFLMHLEYTTDYRIASRTRLAGFDSITALDGVQVQFALANTFADRRKAPVAGNRYRVVVFDHKEGREYMFKCGAAFLASFSTRSASVTIPTDAVSTECKVVCRDSSVEAYADYEGDWAMYDGHVGESGRVDVAVDVRIPARKMSAGSKCLLDKIIFGGADAGMTLTLSKRCSLRPVFSTAAGYGSRLAFADIAAGSTSQLDLLAAVARMYNLRFFTDRHEGKVFVEPLEEFYGEGKVVDWSDRIDYSQPLSLADAGIDAPQWRVLGYADGDVATAEFNSENDTVLGEWHAENPLYGTKPKRADMRVALFVPTVNATGVVAGAPSAEVMRVGDAGADEQGAEQPFSMHVVRYCGLRPLPDGERWVFPHEKATYPYAAFFGEADGEPFTLGFEERNGAEGLHRYHDEALRRERECQYLHCHLRLSPADIEQLLTPDDALPSFRSRFRLTIGGECSLYRLHAVADYNPARVSTECVFERLTNDD